jgi:LysM repeat protein
MHSRIITAATVVSILLLPASASAYFVHVVAPGESLTSVAAQDGLSVAQLAAANGLSPDSYLVSGQGLQIPPQSYGYTAAPVDTAAPATTTTYTSYSSDSDTADSGGYVVQPGDTLSAIAARMGTTVAALAAGNGLDPDGILYAGSTLSLSGAGSTTVYASTSPSTVSSSTAEGQPVGAAAEGTPGTPPYPTPERVSSSEISSIATANGVSPSLAEAIGWQESGWNNDLTSSAGAVGVMQILPGTWDWINRTLTSGTPLAPASAADNVRGGVLLLYSLVAATGSYSEAAAGYYQGLSSVQQNGMYPDTQQYVNSVMALRSRFCGC